MREASFGEDEFEALLVESARAAAEFDENERVVRLVIDFMGEDEEY